MNRFVSLLTAASFFVAGFSSSTAQTVNDKNTPLHLMKPAYKLRYGISKPEEVKAVIDRVLRYVEQQTPAELVDKNTGKRVTKLTEINADTQLRQGGFRLTSYEWGVTYSAMIAAYQATGDKAYMDYVTERHALLADIVPFFKQIHSKGGKIDVNVRRVVEPHALDDAGAVCCSMIKAQDIRINKDLKPLIDNYIGYIMNQEYRLSDGTFARLRPHKNTVWLDDMFMGVPALAYRGKQTKDSSFFDEAAKQVLLFKEKMFVPEMGLFRHGWVEDMTDHPAFFWGRANGWAVLTMCEVLDVLPQDHPKRNEILNLLRSHLRGLARVQHHDGFWHQLLDRNDTYLETSATAIYTYAFAHAVNKGWVDAKAYGPVAQLGWHAVESAVNEVGQVQGVCVGTGMGFDPAFYAYGPVIWAGAEMIQLLKAQHPKTNDSAVMFYDQPVPTDEPIFNYDGKIRY